MGLIDTLKDLATDEVEAGGLTFRIRKVTTAELREVQHATLAMLPTDEILRMAKAKGQAGEDADPTPEDQANREREYAEMMRRAKPEDVRRTTQVQSGVVCAGTVAVRHPGTGEWEGVKLSIRKDSDDAAGILNVRDLPSGAEDALFAGIMSLSTGGGRASEWLASFRKPAGDGAVG